MWTERQAIEIFHLLFLRNFSARVDKALFVLKGGCNLRFYHRSIRYSEDMDLDIRTMAQGTLRSNVEAVLGATSFRHALRAQQLEVAEFSAPKQTQATQRWKVQLRQLTPPATFPTKIEFSRRTLDDGAALAAVEPELIRRYRLYPVLVQHYGVAAAFAQKISALALRTETQARDIFDLKLLSDAGAAAATPLHKSQLQQLPQAIDNAMSISFDDFVGQVVAFLEPEHQADFRGRASWETLQEQVVDTLRGLAR
jgi:predicted nucleotidyltransferase component of viral defense system